MNKIHIPRRPRGRPDWEVEEQYFDKLHKFAETILKIESRLEFKVSSRGWCYILENEAGLAKGDFDIAQIKINECRKTGLLPIDICAMDESREFSCIEEIGAEPKEEAVRLTQGVLRVIKDYTPISFWQNQKYYVQLLVEKIDLRTLFEPICQKYYIPIASTKGWGDLNQRYDMMCRFAYWEERDKECVLLYCGDFDPYGKLISDKLTDNMIDMKLAVGWAPSGDIIDRFGLNEDFINQFDLSWIDGLGTGSGKDLASPEHKKHYTHYVQDWLERYGPRKVEANALVVRPQEGRKLCEKAIRQYVRLSAPKKFQIQIEPYRKELLKQFKSQIRKEGE